MKVLLGLLLLIPVVGQAQMHKCKDERGRLNISDIPCKGQVRVPPRTKHASAANDIHEEGDKPDVPSKPGAKAEEPAKPAPNTPRGKAYEAAARHAKNQDAVRELRERCNGWREERMRILESSGATVRYDARGERIFKADQKTTARYDELTRLINACPRS